MDAIHDETMHGYRIRVEYDEDPMDPREWDNLGTMVCGHRRYTLGDEQGDEVAPHVETIGELAQWAKDERGATVVLPLYLLDHSGLAMRTGPFHEDPGGWDSGVVGIIFDTPEGVARTQVAPENVERCLRGEVEEYDAYLQGMVYAYVVEDAEGEPVDSCCGFYDEGDALAEARSVVEHRRKFDLSRNQDALMDELVPH